MEQISTSAVNDTQLVEKARGGCADSMNKLAEQVQDVLYSYIYRMTLDANLAYDIRQETLLEMVRSLKNLRKPESFRPWLYRTAWCKLQQHFRPKKNRAHMSLNDKKHIMELLDRKCRDGLKELISKEIAESLVAGLSDLSTKHRSVLVLRCYENLTFSQISDIMNCSEVSARVLFCRAKNKLREKLSRKGVTKALFLPLLGLFGQATVPSESTVAAIHLTASTLRAGTVASVVAAITSKIGMSLLSLLAGLALIFGSVTSTKTIFEPQENNLLSRNSIKSFHFVRQAWDQAHVPNANLLMGKSLSKGAYEQWYFFPDGIDGPMFSMKQRWNPQMSAKLCGWLQDGSGNYYYHSGKKTIYMYNHPLSSKMTMRLPTDSIEFIEFLDRMEGPDEGNEYIRDPETNLLTGIVDKRFFNAINFKSDITYNKLDEKQFGNFRHQWPDDCPVVDERDALHKQGWGICQITGNIRGVGIEGFYRTPFIYDKLQRYPPFLKLRFGDQILIDCPRGSLILDSNNKVLRSYPAGTFLKGLLRPWMGIHTVDIIRRDAAEKRIPFTTQKLNYQGFYYEKMIISLSNNNTQIIYNINIENNQIDKIQFKYAEDSSLASLGTLEITFLQDLPDDEDMFEIGDVRINSPAKYKNKLWLFDLAEGTLVLR
ncbi:MAG: RNA polymerase sigma factor [Phycisphaerae bacterium]|nr:RNA polymerase sigma factor [Phycisphaerae bacterium]